MLRFPQETSQILDLASPGEDTKVGDERSEL
jgi:hypothetical protein